MSRSLQSLESTVESYESSMRNINGEAFNNGSFRNGNGWTTPNAYIQSGRSYLGGYSMGSNNQGEIDADWTPAILGGGLQIDAFEYVWQETIDQTGHGVKLLDSSGNRVMESGTNNPQWMLNDGSAGLFEVYSGDNYDAWIYYRFEFDWSSGWYDYHLEDLSSGTVREGTGIMDNENPIAKIRFTGTDHGSADYCWFDDLRIESEASILDFETTTISGPSIWTTGGNPVPDPTSLNCNTTYEARAEFGSTATPFDQIKDNPDHFTWNSTGGVSIGSGQDKNGAVTIFVTGSGDIEFEFADGFNSGASGYNQWQTTSLDCS